MLASDDKIDGCGVSVIVAFFIGVVLCYLPLNQAHNEAKRRLIEDCEAIVKGGASFTLCHIKAME